MEWKDCISNEACWHEPQSSDQKSFIVWTYHYINLCLTRLFCLRNLTSFRLFSFITWFKTTIRLNSVSFY